MGLWDYFLDGMTEMRKEDLHVCTVSPQCSPKSYFAPFIRVFCMQTSFFLKQPATFKTVSRILIVSKNMN